MKVRFAALVLSLVAGSGLATGATISIKNVENGVWSTGLNNTGAVLTGGNSDPHYVIISAPAGCNLNPCGNPASFVPLNALVVMGNDPFFTIETGPFPGASGWSNNSLEAMWVGPRANQNNTDVGTGNHIYANNTSAWIYRLSFVIPVGFNPFATLINLNWISDNSTGDPSIVSTIRVNGNTVLSGGVPVTNLGQGSAITNSANNVVLNNTNASFVSGVNTIDFVVYNQILASGQNPSGLRVVINSATVSDDGAGIPEPTTLTLLAAGLFAVAVLRRRQ